MVFNCLERQHGRIKACLILNNSLLKQIIITKSKGKCKLPTSKTEVGIDRDVAPNLKLLDLQKLSMYVYVGRVRKHKKN